MSSTLWKTWTEWHWILRMLCFCSWKVPWDLWIWDQPAAFSTKAASIFLSSWLTYFSLSFVHLSPAHSLIHEWKRRLGIVYLCQAGCRMPQLQRFRWGRNASAVKMNPASIHTRILRRQGQKKDQDGNFRRVWPSLMPTVTRRGKSSSTKTMLFVVVAGMMVAANIC